MAPKVPQKKNPFDALANKPKPKPKRKSQKTSPQSPASGITRLEVLINRKLSLWHDDEYDAGKDW